MIGEEFIEHIHRADNYQVISLLFKLRVINDEQKCIYCNVNMRIKTSKRHIDGFEWRCMNYLCKHYQTSLKLRHGSSFSELRISFKTILVALYHISYDTPYTKLLERRIITKGPLLKLKDMINEKIANYFKLNPVRLGGPGVVVQVDETKLNFNVKNHRGRHNKACWALCIVDSSYYPALGYVTLVKNRSAESLLSIIDKVIIPGSIIHSDEWAAYKALGNSNVFSHRTICHKYNFIDPITSVHTQNVESYNNKLKLKIKAMKGLSSDQRIKFLHDFMFRERHMNGKFEAFIKLF